MRIAITINTSWNIYNFRSGLINTLIAQGNEVLAIAPKDDCSAKLEAMGCKYIPIYMSNTGTNPINDLQLLLQLKKIYKEQKPDIILQFTVKPNIYGTLAASAIGIPVINNVSGLGTVFLSKGLPSLIAKWLYKISFRKANLIFFQNKDDQRDFFQEIPLPNVKHDLLPGSGINLKEYKAIPRKKAKKFIFLMIARLIIDKGVIEFIEAASMMKKEFENLEFQLLGQLDENHNRGIPKRTIEEANQANTINYLGQSTDVRKEISSCDCVVLPSYREGTPKTLLEAASMARPIIATDVPGCRDLVRDGINGFLCSPMNSADLKTSMKKIYLLEQEKLVDMGKMGRKLVEESYDEKLVIKKYLNQISKIIK